MGQQVAGRILGSGKLYQLIFVTENRGWQETVRTIGQVRISLSPLG